MSDVVARALFVLLYLAANAVAGSEAAGPTRRRQPTTRVH